MAQFAQPTPDENLVPGWNVQSSAPAGFAQAGVAPTPSNLSGQLLAGFPYPPGAANVGSENSASYSASSLANPGYADGQNTALGGITAPAVPASTVAALNPSGLAALVTLSGGTTTIISTAPWNVGGSGAASFTQVGTTTPATVTVPPAGYIKVTYSGAPTWTWVTTN
jgi:hypothetical protein